MKSFVGWLTMALAMVWIATAMWHHNDDLSNEISHSVVHFAALQQAAEVAQQK